MARVRYIIVEPSAAESGSRRINLLADFGGFFLMNFISITPNDCCSQTNCPLFLTHPMFKMSLFIEVGYHYSVPFVCFSALRIIR
jgi:hypothetical protein